jgi:hypothetical protein
MVGGRPAAADRGTRAIGSAGTGRLLDELPAVSPVAVLGRDVMVASDDWMLRLTPAPSRFGPTGSLLTQ